MAHFCSMCGPKFCSMKITQDLRAEVRAMEAVDDASSEDERLAGLAEKAQEFNARGAALYIPAE